MARTREAFERTYQQLYGRLLEKDTPVFLVNARTVVSSEAKISSIAAMIRLPEGPVPKPGKSQVFFDGRWLDTARYERMLLPSGTRIDGPALLLQSDSTCFVEPGYTASVHSSGNIFIQAGLAS